MAMEKLLWTGPARVTKTVHATRGIQHIGRPAQIFSKQSRLLHLTSPLRQQGKNESSNAKLHAVPTYKEESGPKISMTERRARLAAELNGPLSPEARAFERRLQLGEIEPSAALHRLIAERRLTCETVSICLNLIRDKYLQIPRKERPTEVKKTYAGLTRRLLVYMWEDPRLWRKLLETDSNAVECLCYLTVLEGIDNYIFDWMRADVDFKGYEFTNMRGANAYAGRWRGQLLLMLVTAHVNNDRHNELDRALQCFFKAYDLKVAEFYDWKRNESGQEPRVEKPGFLLTPMTPAQRTICNLISSGCYFRTDVQLYDRFVEYCVRLPIQQDLEGRPGIFSRRVTLADLRLHHPITPSASSAMELLRDSFIDERQLPSSGRTLRSLKRIMEQAHMFTTEQNETEDAAWIAKKYSETFGEPVKIHEHYQIRFWKPGMSHPGQKVLTFGDRPDNG